MHIYALRTLGAFLLYLKRSKFVIIKDICLALQHMPRLVKFESGNRNEAGKTTKYETGAKKLFFMWASGKGLKKWA